MWRQCLAEKLVTTHDRRLKVAQAILSWEILKKEKKREIVHFKLSLNIVFWIPAGPVWGNPRLESPAAGERHTGSAV